MDQNFLVFLSFMIQPEYKKKNNTIFMCFDLTEMDLINKLIKLKLHGVLTNFVKPHQSPTYLPTYLPIYWAWHYSAQVGLTILLFFLVRKFHHVLISKSSLKYLWICKQPQFINQRKTSMAEITSCSAALLRVLQNNGIT